MASSGVQVTLLHVCTGKVFARLRRSKITQQISYIWKFEQEGTDKNLNSKSNDRLHTLNKSLEWIKDHFGSRVISRRCEHE